VVNLKGQELANYAADTLDDLTRTARRGITRVRRRPRLLFAFLDRTGLSLRPAVALFSKRP
jgi:hypothetical protein